MSAVTDLLLATNNSKKLTEIRAIVCEIVSGRILAAADFPELPEPEETGTTFAENARIKADAYCAATGLPTLADDSGLAVDALDGRPGVYSARYAPTDAEKISKLLKELEAAPPEQRTARFVCALCLSMPGGLHVEVQGTLEGTIGYEPTGSHGFGYDPVFLVTGHDKTLAELPPEVKNSLSHRAVAIQKLKTRLLENNLLQK